MVKIDQYQATNQSPYSIVIKVAKDKKVPKGTLSVKCFLLPINKIMLITLPKI